MKEFIPSSNIYTIDALYVEPGIASIHLIRSGDEIAIVDTGTQHSFKQVKGALKSLNLNFSDVRYIILTHIHLDHAGGASVLMDACKSATLVVHPLGSRHMVNPEKLIAGSVAVYGEQRYKALYGEITAIEEHRILSPKENETISLGNRILRFIDSPGHARHHHCIIDEQTQSIFTGDTLGLSYQALRNEKHAVLITTTTPIQFDPIALHQSIDKIMALKPETLYLTHYSGINPSAQNIAGLHEQIDDLVALTEQTANRQEDFTEDLQNKVFDYLCRRAANELPTADSNTLAQWLKFDAILNAQGLAYWWQNARAA